MRTMLQALLTVPISESIGKAVGGNTMLGTGVALVASRVVMRSFAGMVVLGVVAGGIQYLQARQARTGTGNPGPAATLPNPA